MNEILSSPFKFLDSYQKEDKEIFFGRKVEVEELYSSLSGVKQLLLYGPSGSGKTSVIECGLRNQFSDADWLAITIRRGENLNISFYSRINEILKKKISLDPVSNLPSESGIDFAKAVEKLYGQCFRPVYLLFDQFEEVLIQGTEEEKSTFFESLNKLIRYKVPCKVVLIMREDFIGFLSEFEGLCPGLFQNRFRVEKMGKSNVRIVINDILTSPHYLRHFDVVNRGELCESILTKLPDNKNEIELAHVQVFLAELWDRALLAEKKDGKPVFSPELIKKDDNLQSVLGGFLKKQFAALDPVYGEKTSLEVLANMITNRNTKLQVSEEELRKNLDEDGIVLNAPLKDLLRDFEIRRIIRTIKSGEQKKYEISHDILAQLIGDSRTEDMKLREKAQEIYALYETRTEKFGQSEINNLQLYKQYRPFPSSLQKLLTESQQAIDNERIEKERQQRMRLRRARIMALVFSVLAIAAIMLGVTAENAKREAKKQEEEARKQLNNFLVERREKDIIRFNELDARAEIILEVNGRPLEILDSMKSIYKNYDTIQKMEWIKKKIDYIEQKSGFKNTPLPVDK